jgi:hypothetical protein
VLMNRGLRISTPNLVRRLPAAWRVGADRPQAQPRSVRARPQPHGNDPPDYRGVDMERQKTAFVVMGMNLCGKAAITGRDPCSAANNGRRRFPCDPDCDTLC